MRTSDFDFDLPADLIAQSPLPARTQSRMMVINRKTAEIRHSHIAELPSFLKTGDLLVLNDTRVIPARLFGQKSDTGGRVEILLLEEINQNHWECLYRASGPPRIGTIVSFAGGKLVGEIMSVGDQGRVVIKLTSERPVIDVVMETGFPPLPPYIKRPSERTSIVDLDRDRYQTVYARNPGAIAAPTAGLHFTNELLAALEAQGVGRTSITLHVGPGTFKPVKTELIEDHAMEPERYMMDQVAAEKINHARAAGERIVAVGSTTVRTLETIAAEHEPLTACSGRSSIFIHPPYDFRIVDVMLTNFHLPKSTLIMMISAFAGKDLIFNAYAEAIRQKYRFYSYGDCMLIL
jgi:S-adenosylmethionine:tRNA ribosyltransferase-isomerase